MRALPGRRHLILDHGDGFLDEAHLHHGLGGYDEYLDILGVGCGKLIPDAERVFRPGDVQVVGRESGEPRHDFGFRRHQPLVLGNHVLGSPGGLVETDQATAFCHVDPRAVGGLVERDGLVVVLGLDEHVDAGLHEHRVGFPVRRGLLGEMGEQLVEGVVLAVRLGEQCQRIQGVGSDVGGLVGGPGCFLGQVEIARVDRPLGDADMLPERIAGPCGRVVEK